MLELIWIILKNILKERNYKENWKTKEGGNKIISEIRNEFMKRWDNYKKSLSSASIQEILALRMAQISLKK